VQARWRAFSRAAVPGDGWPVYGEDERAVMVFDRHSHLEHDPAADRRVAWEGFSLAAQ
jgi:para-nitrobenzyl esterase